MTRILISASTMLVSIPAQASNDFSLGTDVVSNPKDKKREEIEDQNKETEVVHEDKFSTTGVVNLGESEFPVWGGASE